jgi:hypothetical protein
LKERDVKVLSQFRISDVIGDATPNVGIATQARQKQYEPAHATHFAFGLVTTAGLYHNFLGSLVPATMTSD